MLRVTSSRFGRSDLVFGPATCAEGPDIARDMRATPHLRSCLVVLRLFKEVVNDLGNRLFRIFALSMCLV